MKKLSQKKIVVIGSGFAGIAAATVLAHHEFNVTVLEKNSTAGGRARYFQEQGFTFDMGPSWYWMPDVFEQYFQKFGKCPSDYYQLIRLDPSYKIFYGEQDEMVVPAKMPELEQLFEKLERGSSRKLEQFLSQAAYKYHIGMHQLVYKPSRSIREFISVKLLYDVVRMSIFQSFHKHVRKYFQHEKLIKLLEFPILFLGATPQNTPALYSLMNYADMKLGTWYPMGGMHQIIKGMVKLAESKGVIFRYNEEVKKIEVNEKIVQKVITVNNEYEADSLIAGADYHHVDYELLDPPYRNYSESYWDKRTLAPSSLIFYIGINKKLKNLQHHNLFFEEDFNKHAEEIYEKPKWPTKPLFYASVTSKTDPGTAPESYENLFILTPVAPALIDSEEIREKYFKQIMDRLERLTRQSIRESIIFKRSYAHKDFMDDYHAYKGNAYGLANTLRQTAILKPAIKNKKVRNLYYTGQFTVPGPGVPPSLISGQVVANEVMKEFGLG